MIDSQTGRERKSYYFYYFGFASHARRAAHACLGRLDSI